ncbi:ABC transporter substrate-binding protein [Nostocales cyanobacterium HT-58-2]|nr:ABC transporter substrate-binding protein [Nostocales cyanobacterium HT-58-2]
MAKFALLIGVSEYKPGLTPLPAATKDVEAVQQVLQHPDIGGFDEVKLLPNPERQTMEEAIETIFKGRQRDDLVLLFFSGHGIKDETGKLYFATRNTRKDVKGELIKATAVAASFVHEVMSNSRSKREVVILDCCFSGAFAEGLSARDNGSVDIRSQLGGEGRAVLTSSTSTQLSFEQRGADLSIYTRFLVEGIETGAADTNDNGVITVDELHEYAKKKVQEVAPTMKPEIYPIKEGYTILLAKAPVGDPKLRYRKEVERFSRRGEISPTGRRTLERLKSHLKLSFEEASAIENEVLQPYREYQERLQEYEQALWEAVQREFPLGSDTQEDLQRFQQILGLRAQDIAPIETRLIADKKSTLASKQDVIPPTSSHSNWQQLTAVLLVGIGIIIGGAVVYFLRPPTTANSCVKEQYSLGDRISLGEEILFKQDKKNLEKEVGVQAFAKGDCQTAINKLNLYRKANPTDPETLIYLNNAKARQQVNKFKIAVSVPIGTNPNVAKEILRGVAQAQDEVNNSGGINSKLLQVAIANDDNDSSQGVQLANHFVKDPSILAVVGHNASDASVSAAPVYQQGGLVMMSPTSLARSLSSIGTYVFRTAPSVSSIADRLSHYAIKKAGKTNLLVCIDPKATDIQSFKIEFDRAIQAAGGNINPTDCDMSAPTFNPSAVIDQAISSGADGLLLYPQIDRINQGLAVAQANKRRLALFGSPTPYTHDTLKAGQAVNGMVLATPWHPTAFPGNPFVQKAQNLWRGPVNWRTATAYDATKAIIAGLQQSNTRDELQKVLRNSGFSVNGATGKIQFLPSGDRRDNAIFLVKVQPNPRAEKGYEFVPIEP